MPRSTHVAAPLPLMDALSAAMHAFAPHTLPGFSGRDPPKRKRGRPRRATKLENTADVEPIPRPSAPPKSFAAVDPTPNHPAPTQSRDAPGGVVPPAKKKARRNISSASTPITRTPPVFVTSPDSSVERYTPVDDELDDAEFPVAVNGLASPPHAETISPDDYRATGVDASPTMLNNSLSTYDGTTIEVEQHHEVFQAHVIDEVAEPDWGVHITIQPEDLYVGVGADEG